MGFASKTVNKVCKGQRVPGWLCEHHQGEMRGQKEPSE